MKRVLTIAAIAAFAALFALPYLGVADYYLSYLYLVFFWAVLATSWGVLSGFTGYWSFGHAAFFGAGVYTTATLVSRLDLPFLLTVPLAAAVAAGVSVLVGLVVFRLSTVRGEFFALLTLSVTFVVSAIVSNSPIDSGMGVFLSGVALPELGTSASGTFYLLALATLVLALGLSRWIYRSRFGAGLLAIHDDEDVAEVKGVPTFRFKLYAFGISSALAGAMGGIHAVYVGYVTVGETFSFTIPLYVVLMSILGGGRHWAGPAIGAALITVLQSSIVDSTHAELGRSAVALALIVVILVMPEGIVPTALRKLRGLRQAQPDAGNEAPAPVLGDAIARVARLTPIKPAKGLLNCTDVAKSFGGIRALDGVTLEVQTGEILALVGPNGSGKSTLINMISGHYPLTSGSITLDGTQLSGLPPHAIAQLGVARTYQIPRLFDNMTVFENVRLCAEFCYDASAAQDDPVALAHKWLAFTGLTDKSQCLPGELNLHDRKFVEFARALAARPRLLLLDEVLCGLNPTEVDHAVQMIRHIRDTGTTIVFVEHLMRAVVALADRIAVLDQGRLLALGEPDATMRDPRVIRVYLGESHAA